MSRPTWYSWEGMKPRGRVSIFLALLFVLISTLVAALLPVSPYATFGLGEASEFVAYSPDGTILITAGRRHVGSTDGERGWHRSPIRVWDAARGVERCKVASEWPEVKTLRISPDSRLVAAHPPAHGDLKLWNVATGEEAASIKRLSPNPFSGVRDCRFSPDGRFLALTESPDNRLVIRWWDLQRQEEQGTLEGEANSMVFAPDGKFVATVDWLANETGRILLWSLEGQSPKLVTEHRIAADYRVAISPTLKHYATVRLPTWLDESAEIILWDMQTGMALHSLSMGDPRFRHPSIRFVRDGTILAAYDGFSEDQKPYPKTIFWDMTARPKEIASAPGQTLLSPDGKWLAVLGDGGFRLLHGDTYAEHALLMNLKNEGILGGMTSVAFSPDSKHVAVGGLWSFSPNRVARRERGFLNVGSPITSVRIWNVESTREVLGLEATDFLFAPDGKTVATLDEDHQVKLWNLPPTTPMAKASAIAIFLWLLAGSSIWGSMFLLRRRRGRE